MHNLAYADPDGRLIEEPSLRPLARSGWEVGGEGDSAPFDGAWTRLPEGSTIASLADRLALARDDEGETIRISPDAGWAVGAVLPPGYTRTLLPAFDEEEGARVLPVFGYAAVAFPEGQALVAATPTHPLEWLQPRNFSRRDIETAITAGVGHPPRQPAREP